MLLRLSRPSLPSRSGRKVKLVMTLLVRDEADIVSANIEFHLSMGVDFIIATDNLSVDGTTDILRAYERRGVLRYISQEDDDFSQSRWVTHMARLAYSEHGADWVINNDADEFWYPQQGDLKSVLAEIDQACEAVMIERVNFVPLELSETDHFADVMTVRERISLNALGEPLPGKVCHRGRAEIEVDSGNHGVKFAGEAAPTEPAAITILHFPLRSYRQFENKIAKGGAAVRRNALDQAGTWRYLFELFARGDLENYWRGVVADEVAIDSGLRDGRFVRDERLKNALSKRATQPAPFIVGVGRSGTTLLRMMLDAHPDLAIPSETHFLAAFLSNADAVSPDGFFSTVVDSATWGNFAMDEAELRAELDRIESFTLSEGVRAFYRLYARFHGKSRWGDKTPPYRAYMTEIARLLPEVRFIHVIRDGRDVALSYRGLWFGPGDDVELQAQFWVDQISSIRTQSKELAGYREIRYEDLVTSPESTLRSMCAYLDVPYDPRMLDYHRTASGRLAEVRRPFGPAGFPSDRDRFISIYENASRPPDVARIGRWRIEMTPEDRRRYEAIAGGLLRELGYDVPVDERDLGPRSV